MNYVSKCWDVLPKEKSDLKNAIAFTISDNYSFAVANIIMSMYQHCPQMSEMVDIVIYNDGISDSNQNLLRKLHANTFFVPIHFPESWVEMIEHPRIAKWGYYVLTKFFGFELIRRYEKVIFLDSDMLIRGDISELLSMEEDIGWRTILGWDIQKIFEPIKAPDTQMLCGNGGFYVFSNKLLNYGIDEHTIVDTYNEICNLVDGGIDELVIAWIIHKTGATVKEYDHQIYNTPTLFIAPETKLVHFLNARTVVCKPWVNLAAYFYYSDWVANYERWLTMGGDGPMNFTQDDYYKLFSFDRATSAIKLKKKVKSLTDQLENEKQNLSLKEDELKSVKKNNAAIKKENNELHTKITALTQELKEQKAATMKLGKMASKLEKEVSGMKNSASWKITKPLRGIMKITKRRK